MVLTHFTVGFIQLFLYVRVLKNGKRLESFFIVKIYPFVIFSYDVHAQMFSWVILLYSPLLILQILQENNKSEIERFDRERRADFMNMLKGFVINQVNSVPGLACSLDVCMENKLSV